MQLVLEHQKGYFGFRRGHLIRFRNGITAKVSEPGRGRVGWTVKLTLYVTARAENAAPKGRYVRREFHCSHRTGAGRTTTCPARAGVTEPGTCQTCRMPIANTTFHAGPEGHKKRCAA